eukprot:gene8186-201_t
MRTESVGDLEVVFSYEDIYPQQSAYLAALKSSLDKGGISVVELPSALGRLSATIALVVAHTMKRAHKAARASERVIFCTKSNMAAAKVMGELRDLYCAYQAKAVQEPFLAVQVGTRAATCVHPTVQAKRKGGSSLNVLCHGMGSSVTMILSRGAVLSMGMLSPSTLLVWDQPSSLPEELCSYMCCTLGGAALTGAFAQWQSLSEQVQNAEDVPALAAERSATAEAGGPSHALPDCLTPRAALSGTTPGSATGWDLDAHLKSTLPFQSPLPPHLRPSGSLPGNLRAAHHFMRLLGHATCHLHRLATDSKQGYAAEESRSDMFMTLLSKAVLRSESKWWVDELARMLKFLPTRLHMLFDALRIKDVLKYSDLMQLTRCLAITGTLHCRWVQAHFSDSPQLGCPNSAYQVLWDAFPLAGHGQPGGGYVGVACHDPTLAMKHTTDRCTDMLFTGANTILGAKPLDHPYLLSLLGLGSSNNVSAFPYMNTPVPSLFVDGQASDTVQNALKTRGCYFPIFPCIVSRGREQAQLSLTAQSVLDCSSDIATLREFSIYGMLCTLLARDMPDGLVIMFPSLCVLEQSLQRWNFQCRKIFKVSVAEGHAEIKKRVELELTRLNQEVGLITDRGPSGFSDHKRLNALASELASWQAKYSQLEQEEASTKAAAAELRQRHVAYEAMAPLVEMIDGMVHSMRDYSALLLVDSRFRHSQYIFNLPAWMQQALCFDVFPDVYDEKNPLVGISSDAVTNKVSEYFRSK